MREKQEIRVIKYIERFGSISPMEAFSDLGITKLATVVSRLKRQNMQFYQYYETTYNRFGEVCHYMRYWLDKNKYEKDMAQKFHEKGDPYDELFYKGE